MKIRNKEKSINPVAAIATGVVIGAGAAIAGSAILKDKKKQEKVKKVIKGVKSQVTGYMEDMQKMADEKINEGKEKLSEGKESKVPQSAANIDK